MKQEVIFFMTYYNLTTKGENYQLDSSQLPLQWKWLVFKPIRLIDQSSYRKTKKQSKQKKSFFELTGKYLKIEKHWNMYDWELFERNYCSEYSGIPRKIVFVTCEMKLCPWNLSFWTYTKLRSLFDLVKPSRQWFILPNQFSLWKLLVLLNLKQ